MRILWVTSMNIDVNIVNYKKNIFTSGGWLGSMLSYLIGLDEVEKIDVICVQGSNNNTYSTEGIMTCHYLKGNVVSWGVKKDVVERMQKIIDEVKPDIIDIQGIEFTTGLNLLECNLGDSAVAATLQGLPYDIAQVYNHGVPFSTLIFGRTLYDNLKLHGLIEYQKGMKIRGENSIKILKKAEYVIGRTNWDKANSLKFNNKLKHYNCARILRDEFYDNQWNIEDAIPYRIFAMQTRNPFKGLHVAVEAVGYLKEKYPNVKLVVPGAPPDPRGGYAKYLRKLAKKYGVENNIEYTGSLVSAQMIEQLLKANVYLQSSLIENSPSSLGEAQTLGVPCVASLAGGTLDYVEHEKSGLIYDKLEAGTCAYHIGRIFDDKDLALKLSVEGRKQALERHDPEENVSALFKIYKDIIEDKAKKH